MTTRHYHRGRRWHLWRMDGFRLGFGVIPRRIGLWKSELLIWFGPLLIGCKFGARGYYAQCEEEPW